MILLICLNGGKAQSLCTQFGNLAVDETLSGTYNSYIVKTNKVLLINGSVTFTGGAKFTNCKIKFANVNGKITLTNGSNTYPGQPPPPPSKYSFITTKVFSCAGQWNSIIVNASCLLEGSVTSEFEGALIAIDAKSNSSIKVVDCIFWDNNVGIKATGNVTSLGIAGNLFTTRIYQHGGDGLNDIRGIHTKDVKNLFDIGTGSISPNIFEKIYVGIGNSNSEIDIKNSKFNYCYVGISVGKTNKSQKITFTGLGKTGTASFTNNVLRDIEVYDPVNFSLINSKSVVNLQGIYTDDKFSNVYFEGIPDSKVSISNNSFYTTGLNSFLFDGNICINGGLNLAASSKISDCEFHGTDNDYHNVVNFSNIVPESDFKIEKNKIFGTNCYSEQFLIWNGQRIKIKSNKFTLTQPIWRAINIQSGRNCSIERNVFDNGYSNESEAIFIGGHQSGFICQDTFLKAYTGIRVEGTTSDFLIVGQNEFRDMKFGLHYEAGAMTNFPNKHSLNRWNIGFGYTKMAKHDAPSNYALNIYEVSSSYPNLTGIYSPPNNMKTPTGDAWFKVISGSAAGCPQLLSNPEIDSRIEGFNQLCDLTHYNSLTEGQRWDVLKSLWNFKLDFPNLDLPQCLDDKIQYIETTNIPDFIDLSNNIDLLYKPTSTLQSSYTDINAEIDLVWEELLVLKEIVSNIEDIQGTEPELAEISSLESELNDLTSQREAIRLQIVAERMTKIDNLLSINAALTPLSTKEDEEKFLNTVNLSLLKGLTPSTLDLNTCKTISERCIFDHGNTVLYAQSLLPEDMQYQRVSYMFCNNQGLTPQDNQVQVRSNVNDQKYINKDRVYATINIFTTEGRMICSDKNTSLLNLLKKYQISSGLYFIKTLDSDSTEHVIKYFH